MPQPQTFSAEEYERKYQRGYGVVYPESHVIRVHRQVLEWELGITSGNMLDFGCGSGSHVKYFAGHGFVPYGGGKSETAGQQTRPVVAGFAAPFQTSPLVPGLCAM